MMKHYDEMFQNEDNFKNEYFPQIKEYSIIYENLRAENEEMRSMKEKVEKWFRSSEEVQEIEFENVK